MSSELTPTAGQLIHTMEDNWEKVQFVILKLWLGEQRDEGWRALMPGCRTCWLNTDEFASMYKNQTQAGQMERVCEPEDQKSGDNLCS